MDTPIWEKFYWCNSGCNTYHDATRPRNTRQEFPNSNNFPGTARERERYIAWLSVEGMDRAEKISATNSRIDTFLNSGQAASSHSLPTH